MGRQGLAASRRQRTAAADVPRGRRRWRLARLPVRRQPRPVRRRHRRRESRRRAPPVRRHLDLGRRALDRSARSAAAGPHGSRRGLGSEAEADGPVRRLHVESRRPRAPPGHLGVQRRGLGPFRDRRTVTPLRRRDGLRSRARPGRPLRRVGRHERHVDLGRHGLVGGAGADAATRPLQRRHGRPRRRKHPAIRRLGRPVAHGRHLAPARRPVERRQDGRRATCPQSRGDDPRHEARLLRPVRRPRRQQRLRRRLGAVRRGEWKRVAKTGPRDRVANNH